MEAVHSFLQIADPISIQFEYPLWRQAYVVPEFKKPGPSAKTIQRRRWRRFFAKIPEPPKAIQRKDLASQFPYGADKLNKLLGGLIKDERVRRRTKKVGKRQMVYFTRSGSDSGKTPEP